MSSSETDIFEVTPHVPVYMGQGVDVDDTENDYIFVGTAEIGEDTITIRLSDRSNIDTVKQILAANELQGLFVDPIHFDPNTVEEENKEEIDD